MSMKRWKIPKPNQKSAQILAEECDISPFIAEILVNRGISFYSQAEEFLTEDISFESPFKLNDMQKAAERIHTAVEEYEKIAVYGDYDCDGVTSTAMLYSYLSLLGANVIYYIPNRKSEGYGVNIDAVRKLKEEQVSLIITVDNGISALAEIAQANRLGMTVIVTDHHQIGEALPDAYAVINPHRKDNETGFSSLAGVGVAFKLIAAMEGGDYEYVLEQFGDLAAIGTIGDVVPLFGENRSIVQYGLKALTATDNVGLQALMEVSGLNPETITSQNVAFGLVPRINAAGRMDDASLAVNLFLSETLEEAQLLAEQLNRLNQDRKSREEKILADIEQQIAQHPEKLYDRVLSFYDEDWHQGIIGIVSSKVLENYGKPNLLMSLDEGKLHGSARSVEEFSLFKALCSCDSYLERFGGHKQAAGFTLSVENYENFRQALEQYAASHFRVMPCFSYQIDKEIFPGELTLENIESLNILEPFGAENQQPLFLLRNAVLKKVTPVSDNKHLRLTLDFGGITVTAMCFRTSLESFFYQENDVIDFLANISISYYNQRKYLSAVVRDIHLSGMDQNKFFNGKTYYEAFRRGETLSQTVLEKMTPSRNEIAVVYKYLKAKHGFQGDIDLLFGAFSQNLNYCKFRLILDILDDVGLIELSSRLDVIILSDFQGKADLEQAETMKILRQMQS